MDYEQSIHKRRTHCGFDRSASYYILWEPTDFKR